MPWSGLTIALFLAAHGFAQADTYSVASNEYSCMFTTSSITIDGVMNEQAWAQAPEINMHIPETHAFPAENATGKLLWDSEALYVFITAPDSDLKGLVTDNDEVVFREDCLEIFLKPGEGNPVYYNFEINAAGGVFDALNKGDIRPPTKWDCEGFEKYILHYGTLNMPEDQDQGWTLEARIPFACFPTHANSPQPGATWRFHLSRYNYAKRFGDEEKELSSTAFLSKVNFHTPEEWNKLVFKRP